MRSVRQVVIGFVLACGSQLHAQSGAAKGTLDGWIISQRTTIDSGNHIEPRTTYSTYTETPGKSRFESEANRDPFPSNFVTITDLASRTKTNLNLRGQSFRVRPISALDSEAIINASSSSHDLKDLGPGGVIAGYETRHYRLEATLTTHVKTGNRTCEISRPETAEFYATTDSAVVELMRKHHALTIAATGINRPREPKIGAIGEFLRSVVTQRYRAKDGSIGTITVTTEITELRRAKIDASMFAPPAGFKLMPLLPASVSRQGDSVMHATMEKFFARMVDSTPPAPGETRHCTTTKH